MIASSAGKASAASTKPVNMACGALGMDQPATNRKKAQGADSDRRKLSSIFHRPSSGIPLPLGPQIQGNNCQSPRTQRCCRDAATSVCEGNSSKNSMSLTSAQRT